MKNCPLDFKQLEMLLMGVLARVMMLPMHKRMYCATVIVVAGFICFAHSAPAFDHPTEGNELWLPIDRPTSGVLDMAVSPTGELWVVTGQPVAITEASTPEVMDGVIRHITTVTGESQGNGLGMWDGAQWHDFPAADLGRPGVLLTAVEVRGQEVWIGTTSGLLRTLWNGSVLVPIQFYDKDSGLAGSWVTKIACESSTGTLWVASRESRFYRYKPTAEKKYWIDGGGVSGWNGAIWKSYPATTDSNGDWTGLAGSVVTAIAPDGAGGVWAGTEIGVGHLSGTTWRNYTASEGLPAGAVRCLALAPDGTVWVGTDSGAAHYQPDSWIAFSPSNTNGFLPAEAVFDIAMDAAGWVWFAYGDGFVSFDPDQQVWQSHPEAGSPGMALAARTSADQLYASDGRILSRYIRSTGVTLLAPPDGAGFFSDETGTSAIEFRWTQVTGATAYELVVDDVSVGVFTEARTARILDAGEHNWKVKALYPGDHSGLYSQDSRVQVGDTRTPSGISVFLSREGTN